MPPKGHVYMENENLTITEYLSSCIGWLPVTDGAVSGKKFTESNDATLSTEGHLHTHLFLLEILR